MIGCYNFRMPYLIDGHNLIGRMSGISLQDLNDEEKLIEQVRRFCGSVRKQAEIYFDQAPPGLSGQKKYGYVKAVFVRSGRTADDAIKQRLRQLKRSAKNWTVVSSDRQVQAEARAAGAAVLESGEFASLMDVRHKQEMESGEMNLDESEIADWLKAFGAEDED